MKTASSRFGLVIALMLVVFLTGFAAPPQLLPAPNGDGTAATIPDINRMATPDVFQLAYEVLGPGKRNYLGHRGGAMSEIEAAAKLLGADIGHKIPNAHDEQPKSDSRLELAQTILLRVRDRLTTDDMKPVGEHVDAALAHLAKGLKIRAVEDGKE